MFDLTTTLTIIGAVAGAISAVAAAIALRRTPKLSKPPITPTCTMILGASVDSGIGDLPTFHPGMRHMGFDR